MTEEFRYQDKRAGDDVNDEGSLQNLVNKEFKRIERRLVRDDKEIRNAGRNICDTLINQIKKDKTMVYGPWALQPLTDLSNTLKKEYKAMEGIKLCTNNADKIHQIANRINHEEDITLERLRLNRTTQDSRDIVKKSEEKDKNNPMFKMELNSANKETGNIIFTKASNPVKIHKAVEGLFDNTDKVYQIDYSNCTNQKIKTKMTQLIGSKTCYLRYDEGQKTYTIRDKDGNGIYNRALIREGVKLIPDGIRKWGAYQEQKKMEEDLGKEDVQNIDANVKNMLKDMPSARNLNQDQQKNLFAKTDERILELLKNAKKLGYDLESECVTKLYVKKGLMEVHFITGSSKRNEIFWKDDSKIGPELYKFLDGEEGEYKTYLTNRIKQKWSELDGLTKTNMIDLTGDKNILTEEEKGQLQNGMSLLKAMLDHEKNIKSTKTLVSMCKLLGDGIYSLQEADNMPETSNKISKDVVEEKLIKPLRRRYESYKGLSPTRSLDPMTNQTTENHSYTRTKDAFFGVFFGDKNSQYSNIRSLSAVSSRSPGGFGLDKTSSSFIKEHIENDAIESDDHKFEVKYTNVNKCIENIYNFNINLDQEAGDFDESGNLSSSGREKVKQIDELYENAKSDKEEFANYLVTIGLLPQNRTKEKKSVLKAVESLQQKLNNTQEQVKNFPTTTETLAQQQHYEKIKLEQKENKTEEDLQRLQALEYLEQNPDERNRINEITINMMKVEMKYGSIRQLLGSDLFKPLAELGGGAIGNNSKIYNDIIGIGWWNLSDENAKLAGEIITEIAITVAVAVVTGGIGGVAMAATLRGAAFVARGAKWIKLANKIYKVINISQKGYKGLSIGAKAVKLGYRSASLLVEGTVFNAASNMIHSAMNGTSLDNLNLNPIAKENVQTAAFLGALSISGRLTQGLMKVGGKTKLSINLMKGLEKAHLQAPAKFTAGLVAEMGSMLAAEQAVNFTFGHDVIDPETGEIRKERFHMPTQEELIQITGMILAFKMVKPQLWHKYEQKLNEGTLEICRGVKKNEVLVRDPKTGKVENIQDLIDGKKEVQKKGNKIENGKKSTEVQNDRVVDKATEQLYEQFDKQIMSQDGITIDGVTYKLEWRPYEGHNPQHKGRIVYTETGPDGKVKLKYETNSNTFVLPENSSGNNIRNRFNSARKKYVERNLNNTLESARQGLSSELSRNIDSKTGELEGKRANRETLERKKKTLSEDIEGLKSKKAQLEQQLQKIQKEIMVQSESISLKDIYSIISKGNMVSIGGKKYKFIGVKGDKITFTEGNGKTREFSSFKELKDAGANFNFDIKNRQSSRGAEQQKRFHELVEREAKTGNTSEIIKKYEKLQQQKSQVERDMRDGFFRENASKLKGKHVWIDGVEYQCTDIKTNNGRTTLDFKKTEGNDRFTISSFEQLKAKGQVNGFGDRYRVQDKNTKAAGRNLSRAEKENYKLLRELFNGESNYINNKTQELQKINQQLQNGKLEYENARLANSPKKVSNPEYEKIQKEIEGIDAQLIEKGQQLTSIERDLGASDTEIARLEQEIAELTAERNNLSRTERGNDIINNEIERGEEVREEVREEIEKPEEMERKLDELLTKTNSGEYENVKLDRVTKAMFEGSIYFEGLSRLFKKNRSLPKKFVKNIRDNFVEMKNRCRETLGEAKKKLVDKWNNFFERKLAEEGDVIEVTEEEIKQIEIQIESIDGDILSNRGIKDITKKEMDIIQNILKNSELHNIFNKYLETGFIVREGIDKNTTIEQINKEIENIEKAISTIEGSKSNLLKIKNILFYVKQNILGRNISNLSGYQKRILATERSRYQTAINDICKRYTKLSKISENIIITEECDLRIIEQSLKDINLLPESTLQKIKDNGITIFLGDKTVTNRGFKNNLRGVHPRGRPEGRTRDEVGGLASGKIAIVGRGMRNGKYHSSIESSTGSPSMILHELGHTFDHGTIGDLNRTQEFIEFHKKLYDKLSSYEQQGGPGGEAGCSEFFAESTAQFFKRGEKKFKKYYGEEYYEYIKKQLVG